MIEKRVITTGRAYIRPTARISQYVLTALQHPDIIVDNTPDEDKSTYGTLTILVVNLTDAGKRLLSATLGLA